MCSFGTYNLVLSCCVYLIQSTLSRLPSHVPFLPPPPVYIQEYFVIPTGAKTFAEAMQIGCEVYHTLGKIIKAKFGGDATLIGDEGGFAPPCDVESGLQLIMEATEAAGYLDKVSVGLDVASSEFKVKGKNEYDLDFKTSGPEKDSSLLKVSLKRSIN